MTLETILLVVLAGLALGAYAAARRARRTADSLRAGQLASQRERDAQAERARQVEAQLSALGLAVLEFLIVVDRQLSVTYATPGAQALFGDSEPVGRSLIAFARSVEVEQLAVDALAAGPASGDTRDELDRIMPIGERPFRVRAAAFDGGAVLALSDVTELQRLGRARRDFVANISHELRTPLTSIRLMLDDLLSGTARGSDQTASQLQRIQVEVDALQHLAQELLDLAQIESGQVLVRMVPTPVEELVNSVVDRLSPQAQRKGQELRVAIEPQLVALADVEQVRRALGNLLHNAIKFTPPGGHVGVRAHRWEGDVVVEVADDGPGIAPDDLARIFERFFQGDRARTGGGTGLGLAIAKHVIQAHGGRIWAESEPGLGATFRFTLPAADQPADSPPAADSLD